MSVSENKFFNSSPKNNVKDCHNKILNYFENGQELFEELTKLASIGYQRYQSRNSKEEGRGGGIIHLYGLFAKNPFVLKRIFKSLLVFF